MATRKKGRTRTSGKRKKTPASRRVQGVRNARAAKRAFTARRGPETLRVRAMIPGLTVNDLPSSLKFYADVLGFIVKEPWKNDKGELIGAMLLAGVCELGLSQDNWAKGRDRKKGEGFRLWFRTAQDVDALARRVKAAGFRLTEEPQDQPWGGRSFSLDDLDGYHLTIHRDK